MSGAHLFILFFFGSMLLVLFIKYVIDMRRHDRADEIIARAIENFERLRKEAEKGKPPP